MNELMVEFGPEQWIYYPTEKKTAKAALKELAKAIEGININTDNLIIKQAVLRNEQGEDIDDLYEGILDGKYADREKLCQNRKG